MIQRIKDESRGRCREIIIALTPIEPDMLIKAAEDHPCPQCNSRSTFFPDDRDGGIDEHGRVVCRNCTDNRPTGDVINTVQLFGGFDRQGQAAKAIAKHLGIAWESEGNGAAPTLDAMIERIASDKNMPADQFRRFRVAASRWPKRDGVHGVEVPMLDGNLNLVGQQFISPYARDTLLRKGKNRSGSKVGAFVPDNRIPDEQTVLVVEGFKDAAALLGLGYAVIGFPGPSAPANCADLFRGKDVIIVPDLDKAGIDGARRTKLRIESVAESVRAARLPGEIKPSKGDDVRDVIARDGQQAVRDAIAAAGDVDDLDGDGRPAVLVDDSQRVVIHTVVTHLAEMGFSHRRVHDPDGARVYQRSGQLVRPVTYDAEHRIGKMIVAKGTTVVKDLDVALIGPWVMDCCRLYVIRITDDGPVQADLSQCPGWLSKAIDRLSSYDAVRTIDGVTSAPTIRPDGSILQEPGYDPATRLVYRPTAEFDPIPDEITCGAAEAAYKRLTDLVCDFPFASDDDLGAWVAIVLSMVGRAAVSGKVPIFAISGNAPGVGKTMLIDTASIVAYGHTASRQAYTSDDSETRKLITAVVAEAVPAVLLDNVDGRFGNKSLDAMLTGDMWSDRILATNKRINAPMRSVWSVTGNNIELMATVARRTILINLETSEDKPQDRDDFTIPRLLEHVAEHRSELLAAALTILRGWIKSGEPCKIQFGSFEEWAEVICGAVRWASAGAADPFKCRGTESDQDVAGSDVGRWIDGIIELDSDGIGVTTRMIAEAVNGKLEPGDEDPYPTLRDVVLESAAKGGRADAGKVGYRLRAYKGRPFDGQKLVNATGHNNTKRWFVRSTVSPIGRENGGDGGDRGDSFSHLHAREKQKAQPECAFTQKPIQPQCKTSPLSPPSPCRHESLTDPNGKNQIFCADCGKFYGRSK